MKRILFALLLLCPAIAYGQTVIATSTFAGSENPLSEGGNWTLSGSGSGVKKVSGVAEAVATAEFSQARWSGTALPSNQYQTLVINLNTGATWNVYMALRYNFVANSGYEFEFASDGTWDLGRYDTGARTTLASGSGVTWSSVETFKFDATGSALTVTRGGSAFTSTTDATYSGTGLSIGFIPHVVSAITDVTFDSIELGTSNGSGGAHVVQRRRRQ